MNIRPTAIFLCMAVFGLVLTTPLTAGTAFTYQGELRSNGDLADGVFDFEFALWDAMSGGNQVGGPLLLSGIPVSEGVFTVELDFGAAVFDNADRWLAINVEGIDMTPRQAVARAPYAIQTRGIYVDPSENVGIGTTVPERQLHLTSPEATMRLTTTDNSPSTVSRLELQSATAQGIFTPLGVISFLNEDGEHVASMSGTKVGADGAQLFLRAGSGNPQVTLSDDQTAVTGLLDVAGPLRVAGQDPLENEEFVRVDDAKGEAIFRVTAASGIFMGRRDSRAAFTIIDSGTGDPNVTIYHAETGTLSAKIRTYSDRMNFPNTPVGISQANPNYQLEVNGTAGKPGGGSWSNSSDMRLKTNVRDIDNALDSLLALRGVRFEYIDPMAISELPGERIGMIAQEVEAVHPDWVSERNDGYKAVTYRGFEALTVEALRDLRDEKNRAIDSLRSENDDLRRRLEALEQLIAAAQSDRSQ